MLPEIGASVHDAPSDCKVLLGDAMSIFRTEAEQSAAASPQLLLKLCRDFTLQAQKRHEGSELAVTDSTVDSSLVHVAALSSSLLQVQVDTLPAAAVEIEKTEADGLVLLPPCKVTQNSSPAMKSLPVLGVFWRTCSRRLRLRPATCCCFTSYPV
jgi:hypothetical protein